MWACGTPASRCRRETRSGNQQQWNSMQRQAGVQCPKGLPRKSLPPRSFFHEPGRREPQGDSMRVQDKSIIVTGAGGGIGEGIAHRLAAEGAQVIVNDIAADRGEAVAAAIRAQGGRATFFQADVTKSADVKALVAAA